MSGSDDGITLGEVNRKLEKHMEDDRRDFGTLFSKFDKQTMLIVTCALGTAGTAIMTAVTLALKLLEHAK